MGLSVNRGLQPLDIMPIKRFQYYIAEDFREDFRIMIVILIILLFIIQVRVRRLKIKALIDLGATRNFINKEFTRRIDYKKEALKEPYGLLMFDETPLIYNDNRVIYYSEKVRFQIDGFKERRTFDIIYLGKLDLILGLFQL